MSLATLVLTLGVTKKQGTSSENPTITVDDNTDYGAQGETRSNYYYKMFVFRGGSVNEVKLFIVDNVNENVVGRWIVTNADPEGWFQIIIAKATIYVPSAALLKGEVRYYAATDRFYIAVIAGTPTDADPAKETTILAQLSINNIDDALYAETVNPFMVFEVTDCVNSKRCNFLAQAQCGKYPDSRPLYIAEAYLNAALEAETDLQFLEGHEAILELIKICS